VNPAGIRGLAARERSGSAIHATISSIARALTLHARRPGNSCPKRPLGASRSPSTS
jgi:hypothetical protein